MTSDRSKLHRDILALKIERLDTNRGFAAANNIGARLDQFIENFGIIRCRSQGCYTFRSSLQIVTPFT